MLIELHSVTERERGVKVIDFTMVDEASKPNEKKKGLFANLAEEVSRRLNQPAAESTPTRARVH